MRGSTRRAPRALRLLALGAAITIVAAACGGGGSSGKSSSGGSGGSSSGKPKLGGKVVYALEGKTTQLCVPRSQLAISGIMIVNAVYDTLTEPDSNGVYVPYLAKAVDHNATYDQWTITLRDGIKFQDGEPLDAAAVAQNINAWRKGILLNFVFSNISNVEATSPTTVVVTMKTPWVDFDSFLWATGRTGIAAPAQLNNDATCDTNLIGTGPFKLKPNGFNPSTGDVDVVKNPTYWRKDANGVQLPYLNEIQFKIQEDGAQRVNGLQGGQFDLMHDDTGKDLADLQALGSQVKIDQTPPGFRELGQTLLDVSKPPLNDLNVRRALAEAVDRNLLNQISNKGKFTIANQVFDNRVMGYVSDPGFPQYNPTDAKKLIDQYKATHGGKLEFSLQSTFDTTTQALAQEAKRQLAQVGVTVDLPQPVDQATIINQAVAGKEPAFLWRNYPGSDPDTLYVWFHSGSTVNFNHIDDPQIDKDLDQGRTTADPALRKPLYEDFNKRMSSQAYTLWSWYENWFVAHKPNVQDILGPNLPDANGNVGSHKPADILAGYHNLLGMWVS